MPEFDDVTQPPHFRSQLDCQVSVIERYTVLLKDGETTATIYPIHSSNDLPPGLLAFLCDEFNMEIERGDTFPFFDTLHIETFQNYWFGSFAAVMVLGDSPNLDSSRQWEKECLGSFFIKPNYPGRCSHICTAGFLVNAGIRGKGIGRTLAECFIEWAPRLGYTYSVFNLVFENNVSARRIWESLNFKRIGRIKSAGVLKGHDNAVDAIIYGRELVQNVDPAVGSYRFDKIKYYLETGRYPSMADRQEKSRLRSSASHYRVENGKLMLKDREVVSDPARQLQICTEIHMTNHGGINKTTAAITERYHWTRIKDTVATAIRNCPECRDPSKQTIPKRNSIPATIKKDLDAIQSSRDHVSEIVSSAQLHNLPSHQIHRHSNVDTSGLLSHDLSELDPDDPSGIIAAVEAAQRNHHHHHHHHHHDEENNQFHHDQYKSQNENDSSNQFSSYSYSSAQQLNQHGNQGDNESIQQVQQQQQQVQQQQQQRQQQQQQSEGFNGDSNEDIPVDPQVSAFDEHVNEGEEIEIARALIQANESVDADSNDDNLF